MGIEKFIASQPWDRPSTLQELRKVENSLALVVRDIVRRWSSLNPGTKAQRELPWWDPIAYNNAVLKEVDEVRQLMGGLSEDLCPVWGILHAAGTQEATAFKDHGPKRF